MSDLLFDPGFLDIISCLSLVVMSSLNFLVPFFLKNGLLLVRFRNNSFNVRFVNTFIFQLYETLL